MRGKGNTPPFSLWEQGPADAGEWGVTTPRSEIRSPHQSASADSSPPLGGAGALSSYGVAPMASGLPFRRFTISLFSAAI